MTGGPGSAKIYACVASPLLADERPQPTLSGHSNEAQNGWPRLEMGAAPTINGQVEDWPRNLARLHRQRSATPTDTPIE